MRIHVYLPEFPAAGDGLISGMIKAVHGLAAGLVANGARVTVLCEGASNSVVETPSGYDIRCFVGAGEPTRMMLSRGLEKYIRECPDPGIFLLNGVFNPNVYVVSRACRRNNIPYIIAPHDPYHPTIFSMNRHLKWPYWYLRERPMVRQARAVQVLDFRHAEWLRALAVHTPVIEVVNGYGPEDVHPESELAWRMEGPPKILYLGRIDFHNKGLDLLLDAFADLKNETDAQLTLQGPDWGDLSLMKRRAERLGLQDRVQFRKPDFDKASGLIAADHDLLVMPSRFEGFGMSALEAMLAGRPIMVSNVAGIAPHVRASGCGVIISADVNQVKAGLMKLISMRSNWKEVGLAGRAYALEHLQWNNIAEKALAGYREILNDSCENRIVAA
jgi:glycosyltransferase involved in cell wall biosynthesis